MRFLTGTLLFLSSSTFAIELNVSGFGSIIGTQVTGGDGYVAHYPSMASYDDSFNMIEESRLGVQSSAVFDEKTSVTLQFTSRGSLDWGTNLEWFYLTYDVKPDLRLQAGRMRLPAYLYSDFMDVGFAYTFIRVPGDAYSVDAVNYNGLSLTYSTQLGTIDTSLQLYAGGETTDPNTLMSYIRAFEHRRDYTDLYGAVLNFTYGPATLRTTYLSSHIEETALDPASVPGFVNPPGEFDIAFYDVALLLDLSPFNIVAEYNEYEYYTSWLGSVSYNTGKWTFHATASDFELNEAWESHSTYGMGLRYDINSNVAFKLQVDKFDDTGYNPFSLAPNPICHCADGDVTVISSGVDFVF